MAQPVPVQDPFRDQDGYFRSPEDAAACAIIASGGQGWTTPAREARRMLTSPDPRYQAIARNWLTANGLPEAGDSEPPGWQNWYQDWLNRHPEAISGPPGTDQGPPLHAVPDLPPPPPAKITVEVEPGSRLEDLLGQRTAAKANLDAAEQHMRTIKDGITAELTSRHPGVGAFDIPAAPGRPLLILRHSAPRYFDAKWFKRDRPDLYETYRRPSPRWTLGVPQNKGDQ